MYLCVCKSLTEKDLDRVADAGHTTAAALIEHLELEDDECCGRCADDIDRFVNLASGRCPRVLVCAA